MSRLQPPRFMAGLDLRARVVALALVPGLVLAALWGTLVYGQRSGDLNQRLAERGQLLSRQLAAAADFGVFSGNRRVLQQLVESVAAEADVRSVRLVDQEGRALAVAGARAPALVIDSQWQEVGPAAGALRLEGEGRIAFAHPVRSPEVVEEDWLELRRSAPPTAAATGAATGAADATATTAATTAAQGGAYAIVEMDTAGVSRELRAFAALLLGLLVLVLPAAWWVALRLSRAVVGPVTSVAEAVQRIGAGQGGVRVRGASGILTMDSLAAGVNEMAGQLERSRSELEERVRQATRELQAGKEDAERADRAKTRFLAAASHDLRQPMHALTMFVVALQQETDDQRRGELLTRVATATHAMGDLLDGLLDISKLDAGGMRVQLGAVSVKQLMARLHATYAGLAAQRNIELVLRGRAGWVLSDPVLLERMLGNLVSNAIRYSPADGTGKVMVVARRSGPGLRFEVRDNGPGIPPESKEAIFEEFMQLDNPERDRSKGLGLGLAIVRRLGVLLGHPVGLRTRPGMGSTFSVTAPQTSAPLQAEVVPSAPLARGSASSAHVLQGRRVLVVDDDVLARESLSRVALMWGADVIESSGDGDILQPLIKDDWWPDLMLTDYRLRNGRDGLALLTQVQQEAAARHHRVQGVLITGDTEEPALRGLQRPGVQVLYKPVRPPELRQVVEQLMRVPPG